MWALKCRPISCIFPCKMFVCLFILFNCECFQLNIEFIAMNELFSFLLLIALNFQIQSTQTGIGTHTHTQILSDTYT